MSKVRNKAFNQMYSNTQEEVNTRDYPYYKTIPIRSISDRQNQMLERLKALQEAKKTPLIAPVPSVCNSQPVYNELPTFNLVKMEGTNCYKVDMPPDLYSEDLKKVKQQVEELEQEIKNKSDIIEGQKCAIATNEITIQEQTEQIHSNNLTIQHNQHYIQQQIASFNHNTAILNIQCNQYNLNNSETIKQQETLNTQYNQIVEYQTQIEQLQSELDSYHQQLTYHGTMLSAFNTLIQNPQYFTQLIATTGSISPDLLADIKPYDVNTI